MAAPSRRRATPTNLSVFSVGAARNVRRAVLAVCLAACGPSVRVQAYGQEPGPALRAQPLVFPSPTAVPRRYRVTALIVAEGTNRAEQELVAAARRKARSIGAEGIILLRQEVSARSMAMGETRSLQLETRRLYAAAIRFVESDADLAR